jgi:DhnA family fructose-bisphosphate aldolase class Ia
MDQHICHTFVYDQIHNYNKENEKKRKLIGERKHQRTNIMIQYVRQSGVRNERNQATATATATATSASNGRELFADAITNSYTANNEQRRRSCLCRQMRQQPTANKNNR